MILDSLIILFMMLGKLNPDMKFPQLLDADIIWSVHQQILGPLIHRESYHFPDVILMG